MSRLAVINLGKGDIDSGFSLVTAQLWDSSASIPMQFVGGLPPLPELASAYRRWQRLYEALYAHLSWRQIRSLVPDIDAEFEVDDDDVTNVSAEEFQTLSQTIPQLLNEWLNSPEFRPIDQRLRSQLRLDEPLQVMLVAEAEGVMRLPWGLWQFLSDYPQSELTLAPLEYARSLKSMTGPKPEKVRILAIFGSASGLDLEDDLRILQALPHAELTLLLEPTPQELTEKLWQAWDVLFFAGHSHTSQQLQGYIQINEQERLSIEQLRYGLRKTISLGLKLAIFNSCDGLGLARELGDLQIPQVIVMREPVPNRVAQAFLRNFLTIFAAGAALFTAVREAREKLQSLESLFPCATWLPVLCHNPAEKSGRWQDWYELRSAHSSNSIPWRKSARQTGLAVAIAGLTVTTRALGLWQPVELWTYDRFLNLRPTEKADERLLVVEITESDLKAQGPQRQGSLSDTAFEQALQQLSSAAVIGADIYRDYASQPALAQQLATDDRLISLCKNRDAQFDPTGIAPPPEVPLSQVGFSDFVEDRDGILRRHLLLMTPDAASPCQTPYAFSTQIALRYLFSQELAVEFTPSGNLQLGDRVLTRLPSNGGGYQGLAMAGNQLMLNYRQVPNPPAISDRVTLSQLLSGQVASSAIDNRVVLIGVTAPSSSDFWPTPLGLNFVDRVPGVYLQAQMISQLLSAALDERPLITVWSWWQESIWILGWTLIGTATAIGFAQSRGRWVSFAIANFCLVLGSYCLLLMGFWVPLLPPLVAMGLAHGGSRLPPKLQRRKLSREGNP